MPILFECTLVCDADDCENTQRAVAEIKSNKSPLTLGGLLDIGTPMFDFRYDTSEGLTWVMGGGKAACSARCAEKIAEQDRKEEQAPGGKGRPLSVVEGTDDGD